MRGKLIFDKLIALFFQFLKKGVAEFLAVSIWLYALL
jgi:hypothetical protein